MTQNKSSRLHPQEQHGSQQEPIHMQHKEIKQDDDLEELHIHADPASLR